MSPEQYQQQAIADLEEVAPIFFAPSKAELVKFCRGLTVTSRSLTTLIVNAEAFGFRHERASWQWIPKHLTWDEKLSQKLRDELKTGKMPSIRKINAIFDQRRLFTGHLFFKSNGEWHLLYSDQRDRSGDHNQWKHGPHWHFLNHLLRPDLSLQEIADELDKERPSLKSEIHLRYRE